MPVTVVFSVKLMVSVVERSVFLMLSTVVVTGIVFVTELTIVVVNLRKTVRVVNSLEVSVVVR